MTSFHALIFLLIFYIGELFSETVHTFYGPLEIEEPVLIELIHSPPFQRLKDIHQYGVSYYTKTHPEEYTRFDHSLGVFAILRSREASLEEQISGLLHDVSHTVFSHVGDWVFAKEHQEEDYQSTIHNSYLVSSGIGEILNRYGYTVEQVSPKRKEFSMLEQPLPNLCADRIDYNIQGAYFQKFITREETKTLFLDLSFEDGKWIITDLDLAAKLTSFSLFMTENCWGSATNCVTSRWLADAILQGIEIGIISWHEFHTGIDEAIWNRLLNAQDPFIQNRMQMVNFPGQYCRIVDPAQAHSYVQFKCRGINPWVKQNGKIIRLTSIRPELEEALQKMRRQSSEGWPVEFLVSEEILSAQKP
ncbi:MAG: HD domain-containing protein [Simkania sp.]|nr:HD domain-containing protein [Simkania sp.]